MAGVAIDPDRNDGSLGQASLDPDLLADLTDFVFALRVAGMPVTIEQSMQFLRAVDAMRVRDCAALHAAGRDALCCGDDDIPLFDDTFTWFFAGRAIPIQSRRSSRRGVVGGGLFRRG